MSSADHRSETQISVDVDATSRTIGFAGELDLATHDACLAALTTGMQRVVVLDLVATTFMDCAGYRAITQCLQHLRGTDRSLVVQGASGQPAHLLLLIEELNSQRARS